MNMIWATNNINTKNKLWKKKKKKRSNYEKKKKKKISISHPIKQQRLFQISSYEFWKTKYFWKSYFQVGTKFWKTISILNNISILVTNSLKKKKNVLKYFQNCNSS